MHAFLPQNDILDLEISGTISDGHVLVAKADLAVKSKWGG